MQRVHLGRHEQPPAGEENLVIGQCDVLDLRSSFAQPIERAADRVACLRCERRVRGEEGARHADPEPGHARLEPGAVIRHRQVGACRIAWIVTCHHH